VAESRAVARDPRIERGLLAQLAERRRRLDAGERSLGWKLGMGVPAAMEKLAISAPLVGFMLEPALLRDGETCALEGWSNPRLEPEIAVHMGADLPGGSSAEDARRAVAGLGVAIEIVDPDPDASDPEAILAADIFHRHVLLGPLREGADAAGVSARILRAGEEVAAVADATEATGDPFGLVVHVADTVAASGELLRAGEVVICGSVVPAPQVAPGERWEVVLDPLGSLSVAFS
jgi:2-keto-4-pentenoate hydratase